MTLIGSDTFIQRGDGSVGSFHDTTNRDSTDATDPSGRSPDVLSGIMLTLGGPDGPPSVELSERECAELAEAVADAGVAFARSGGVVEGGSPDSAGPDPAPPVGTRLDRRSLAGTRLGGTWLGATLQERFPAGSAVARWMANRPRRADPAVIAGADGGNPIANIALMDALRSSLAAASSSTPSAGARVLLRVLDLATAACRQRTGFERAVFEARIESMKQLAYGAGHEINNPLANIATRAQALLPAERDPERRRRLAAIIDQAFRARDMIGALMLFARPPRPASREATAQAIVAAAVEAVEASSRARDVRVRVDAAEKGLVGLWDATQLEEAVRAVLMNAVEASRGGGDVRVTVARDPEDPAACRVQVVDDGQGMDRETLARAFDPFFSGREAGRGIGLGLSKAWRLVEINGGRTTIDSRFGVGTTVSILLPMSSSGDAASARRVDASSPV